MRQIQIREEDYITGSNAKGLRFRLSVYDVPRSTDASYDEATGVLTLTFNYVDHEPAETQRLASYIRVEIGRRSGKILALKINAKQKKVEEVVIEVGQQLEDKSRQLPRPNQKGNYEFISNILRGRARELAVAAAG